MSTVSELRLSSYFNVRWLGHFHYTYLRSEHLSYFLQKSFRLATYAHNRKRRSVLVFWLSLPEKKRETRNTSEILSWIVKMFHFMFRASLHVCSTLRNKAYKRRNIFKHYAIVSLPAESQTILIKFSFSVRGKHFTSIQSCPKCQNIK